MQESEREITISLGLALHSYKTFNLIQTIGYQPDRGTNYAEPFHGANLKILMERFGKDSFINRTEAESLAKLFNVQPERVLGWFRRQRKKGSFQTVEKLTKVITLN